MKMFARVGWLVVLGTALALSWWSLDAFARRFGMPGVLSGMVSVAIDGAALVLAEQAMKRAAVADSAAGVKLLMVGEVALSAWLNYEHGLLLGYPVAVRVLFASPSVIAGMLFEFELSWLHTRQRRRGRRKTAPQAPQFGPAVWVFHPFAALHRLSRITGAGLESVPLTVMNWETLPTEAGAATPMLTVAETVVEPPAVTPAPVESSPVAAFDSDPGGPPQRIGRRPVADEIYVPRLRDYVASAGGAIPSAREVARALNVGQDRAGRLVAVIWAEQQAADA